MKHFCKKYKKRCIASKLVLKCKTCDIQEQCNVYMAFYKKGIIREEREDMTVSQLKNILEGE